MNRRNAFRLTFTRVEIRCRPSKGGYWCQRERKRDDAHTWTTWDFMCVWSRQCLPSAMLIQLDLASQRSRECFVIAEGFGREAIPFFWHWWQGSLPSVGFSFLLFICNGLPRTHQINAAFERHALVNALAWMSGRTRRTNPF